MVELAESSSISTNAYESIDYSGFYFASVSMDVSPILYRRITAVLALYTVEDIRG